MGARKIVLIDANNLAYRAFYALPETISTTSGTVTNAVYGFTSMLLKLIEEQKPHTIICAFDSKVPTFRHKLFEEYKIQRKKMPLELVNQISLIKEILDSFNIPCVEVDGYEADDVLASIACLADKKFDEILIVTGDKDMLQLVSDKIKVMAVKKGITDTVIYDKEKVKEKFGVEPVRIRDLLALMGDNSDNIPGIPGIGPKIAQKLLDEYKTLDNIYQHLDEIKSESVRDLLSRYREQVDISKKLVELNTNLEVGVDGALSRSLEDLDYKRIEKIFDSLEFKTLKERIKKSDLFCKKSY
ncbi:MAG: DNA polymerase I, partial [Actinobacteria bacterium]|nr:DNA polymerase I [Actinomycetota bacterium]